MKNIGPTIKKLRKERHLTQTDVAKLIGISQTYLSLVEASKANPSIGVLDKIGQAIHYPWEVILFLSMKVEDVPWKKREAFRQYYPSISKMIKEFF